MFVATIHTARTFYQLLDFTAYFFGLPYWLIDCFSW